MGWVWAAIRRDWPGVDDLAYQSPAIVDAFNRLEERLGPQSERWGPRAGTYAPLSMICDGRRLSALDDVPHVDHFVRRLRRDDPAAWAELEALYILRSGAEQTEAEIEPAVTVGGRPKRADSRIRRSGDEAWTYVEVTRPGESRARKLVSEYLRPYMDAPGPGEARTVTLLLRRSPTENELLRLRDVIAEARTNSAPITLALPDELGSLVVRAEQTNAGHGLAMIKWVVPDPRGVHLLRREAPQLPAGSSTIVMLDVSSALVDWSRSLGDYLAEGKLPWVSAVCLFTSDFASSPRGESWRISARLVENPDPAVAMPAWIREVLQQFIPSGVDGP